MEHLLTCEEVAKLLHQEVTTIQRWSRINILPAIKIGRRFLFKEEDVEEWVNGRKISKTPRERLSALAEAGQEYFRKWCKARKIDYRKLSEEKVMRLLNKEIAKHRKPSRA